MFAASAPTQAEEQPGPVSPDGLLGVLRSGGATEQTATEPEPEPAPEPTPEAAPRAQGDSKNFLENFGKFGLGGQTGLAPEAPKAATTKPGEIRMDGLNARGAAEWDAMANQVPGLLDGSTAIEEDIINRQLDANGAAPQAMDYDTFLGLSPQGRAAVQWNSALANALTADQALAAETPRAEDYDARVAGLFGENGGSDSYSPNVLALLEQTGFVDQERGDLDNFLNGAGYITDDEITRMGAGEELSGPRADLVGQLNTNATASLTAALADGQAILDAWKMPNQTGMQSIGLMGVPGGDPNSVEDVMATIYNTARDKNTPSEQIFSEIGEVQERMGVTPEQAADYFERQLLMDDYFAANGEMFGENWRTPDEFRAILRSGGAG